MAKLSDDEVYSLYEEYKAKPENRGVPDSVVMGKVRSVIDEIEGGKKAEPPAVRDLSQTELSGRGPKALKNYIASKAPSVLRTAALEGKRPSDAAMAQAREDFKLKGTPAWDALPEGRKLNQALAQSWAEYDRDKVQFLAQQDKPGGVSNKENWTADKYNPRTGKERSWDITRAARRGIDLITGRPQAYGGPAPIVSGTDDPNAGGVIHTIGDLALRGLGLGGEEGRDYRRYMAIRAPKINTMEAVKAIPSGLAQLGGGDIFRMVAEGLLDPREIPTNLAGMGAGSALKLGATALRGGKTAVQASELAAKVGETGLTAAKVGRVAGGLLEAKPAPFLAQGLLQGMSDASQSGEFSGADFGMGVTGGMGLEVAKEAGKVAGRIGKKALAKFPGAKGAKTVAAEAAQKAEALVAQNPEIVQHLQDIGVETPEPGNWTSRLDQNIEDTKRLVKETNNAGASGAQNPESAALFAVSGRDAGDTRSMKNRAGVIANSPVFTAKLEQLTPDFKPASSLPMSKADEVEARLLHLASSEEKAKVQTQATAQTSARDAQAAARAAAEKEKARAHLLSSDSFPEGGTPKERAQAALNSYRAYQKLKGEPDVAPRSQYEGKSEADYLQEIRRTLDDERKALEAKAAAAKEASRSEKAAEKAAGERDLAEATAALEENKKADALMQAEADYNRMLGDNYDRLERAISQYEARPETHRGAVLDAVEKMPSKDLQAILANPRDFEDLMPAIEKALGPEAFAGLKKSAGRTSEAAFKDAHKDWVNFSRSGEKATLQGQEEAMGKAASAAAGDGVGDAAVALHKADEAGVAVTKGTGDAAVQARTAFEDAVAKVNAVHEDAVAQVRTAASEAVKQAEVERDNLLAHVSRVPEDVATKTIEKELAKNPERFIGFDESGEIEQLSKEAKSSQEGVAKHAKDSLEGKAIDIVKAIKERKVPKGFM